MSESKHGWEACPPGELTKLSAALAFQRKLRIAALVGVVLLAGAGLAGAGWVVHSALKPAPPECAPCHENPAPCDEGAAKTATP
jgi:hypothetical protein